MKETVSLPRGRKEALVLVGY